MCCNMCLFSFGWPANEASTQELVTAGMMPQESSVGGEKAYWQNILTLADAL